MDAQDQVMPLKQRLKLLLQLNELETQGKLEEAADIRRQIPIPPYLAKFAKEQFGVEFVKNCGWNMAAAEVEYGLDWLTK